mgnify:FL=1
MKIDCLLTDGEVFNVYLKKWTTADVAILDGKILFVGNASSVDFEPVNSISCHGGALIPGLIDIHMHIESSFLTPLNFARAVVAHGTTTIVSEPHEMANVLGVEGINGMIEAGKDAPIDIFYGIPSSVPSTNSELETTGGKIGLKEIETLLNTESKKMVCLGEVMNYTDLMQLRECRAMDFVRYMREHYPFLAVEGHVPSIKGFELSKVLFTGVDSDHCMQSPEGLYDRLSMGMFVELQESSITVENMAVLNNLGCNGRFSLVTDDVPPDKLTKAGHLDFLMKLAVEKGLPFECAIIATTLSPAMRMGFRDRGAIAPGKIADIVFLRERSKDLPVTWVMKKGEIVYSSTNNSCTLDPLDKSFNDKFYRTINTLPIKEKLFRIEPPIKEGYQRCRVIEKNPANTSTKEIFVDLPVKVGELLWQEAGLNMVAVINRYGGDSYALGLVGGNAIRGGAFASSYAHDHHNLLVIGDNVMDMAAAANWVVKSQGGMVFVSKGKTEACLRLPVGGLLSENCVQEVAQKSAAIKESLTSHGFKSNNPIMSICTITLPVSPALKITDKGLVDTLKVQIVPLFI